MQTLGIKDTYVPTCAFTTKAERNQVIPEGAPDIQKLCREGRLKEAVLALLCIDQQGRAPSVEVYKGLLYTCMKQKASAEAKQVHAHLTKHRLESNIVLGNLVVATLINCGSQADGCHLFRSLSHRTALSWTAIISGYNNAGQCKEALSCYYRMQLEGVQPNNHTFVSLLKACSRLEDLEEGKRIHAEVIKHGLETDGFVGSSLVSMYSKCGSVKGAQNVFDRLHQRTVVSWNAMLAAYAQQEQGERALHIFAEMQAAGMRPNARTLVSALQACASLAENEETALLQGLNLKAEALQKGKEIHAEAVTCGCELDVFVASSLISMYAKCGSIIDAQQVFDGLSKRDIVSWNAMLAAYTQQEEGEKGLLLYDQMQAEGIEPNGRTLVSLLQACGSLAGKEESIPIVQQNVKVDALRRGKAIHAEAANRRFESDRFIGNVLVSVYAKCGSIMDAQHVFDTLHHYDVVSCTAMIAAYVDVDQVQKGLQIYAQMEKESVPINSRTFVSLFQGCSTLAEKEESTVIHGQSVKLNALHLGKEIHAKVAERGFEGDVFVGSTLVNMYSKCGSIKDAKQVFDKLASRNVVSWNSMIAAYFQQGQGEEALKIYSQMQQEFDRPDARTFVSALQACSILAEQEGSSFVDGEYLKVQSLFTGRGLHSEAARRGFELDVFVGNSLVSMYAKCGSMVDARHVFDRLHWRDVVSWNSMIAAYAQQDQGEKALQIYLQMQKEEVRAVEATFLSVLQACGNTGALDICKQAHRGLANSGPESNLLVATSLIDAYGKCGSMGHAQSVFDSLQQPDVVSWTALIAGYARQGDYKTSLHCYEEMRLGGVKPNKVTFLAVLSACSHAGIVEKGLEHFETMTRDLGICAELEHYVWLIDLVGRAGLLSKATEFVLSMPMKPTMRVWLSLLGACQKHGNVELGRDAFDHAVALEPEQAAPYVVMSNIYADAGMWEHAKEIDERRKGNRAWKNPGQTWIEIEQEVHTFLVGDRRNQRAAMAYGLLNELRVQLSSYRD